MISPVTTRQRETSPFPLTVKSLLLHAHVKVGVSFKTAWYPPSQNTMHVSPMKAPLQVGYGNIGSLTMAPSEPQVKTVEAAVQKIAALLSEQLAEQDSPKTVFGQS